MSRKKPTSSDMNNYVTRHDLKEVATTEDVNQSRLQVMSTVNSKVDTEIASLNSRIDAEIATVVQANTSLAQIFQTKFDEHAAKHLAELGEITGVSTRLDEHKQSSSATHEVFTSSILAISSKYDTIIAKLEARFQALHEHTQLVESRAIEEIKTLKSTIENLKLSRAVKISMKECQISVKRDKDNFSDWCQELSVLLKLLQLEWVMKTQDTEDDFQHSSEEALNALYYTMFRSLTAENRRLVADVEQGRPDLMFRALHKNHVSGTAAKIDLHMNQWRKTILTNSRDGGSGYIQAVANRGSLLRSLGEETATMAEQRRILLNGLPDTDAFALLKVTVDCIKVKDFDHVAQVIKEAITRSPDRYEVGEPDDPPFSYGTHDDAGTALLASDSKSKRGNAGVHPSDRKTPRCSHCNRNGHTFAECRTRNVTCNNCNVKGHWAKDCTRSRKNRGKNRDQSRDRAQKKPKRSKHKSHKHKKSSRYSPLEDSSSSSEYADLVTSSESETDHSDTEYACIGLHGLCASSDEWIFDLGATSHMTRFDILTDTFDSKTNIRMANGSSTRAVARGTVSLVASIGEGKNNKINLSKVLYSPELKANLLSLIKLDKLGYKCLVEGGRLKVTLGGKLVATGTRRGSLFYLDTPNQKN